MEQLLYIGILSRELHGYIIIALAFNSNTFAIAKSDYTALIPFQVIFWVLR